MKLLGFGFLHNAGHDISLRITIVFESEILALNNGPEGSARINPILNQNSDTKNPGYLISFNFFF